MDWVLGESIGSIMIWKLKLDRDIWVVSQKVGGYAGLVHAILMFRLRRE